MIGSGGASQEGKGQPGIGWGRALDGLAAGLGWGGVPAAGEGQFGGDASSGGGSVPGGRARGLGFFVRCAATRSGQRRRRGAAAVLRGAGVPTSPLPGECPLPRPTVSCPGSASCLLPTLRRFF